MLDFASINASYKEKVMHYRDLSESGDFLEAIGKIYDELRWAETKQEAKCVLITNFKPVLTTDIVTQTGSEHKDALFDRIFRATSGKEL